MGDVIDLDALVPQPRQVKFEGQVVQIDPPQTGDIIRIGLLGSKLQKAEGLESEELDELVTDLTEQVYRSVPSIKGRPLTTAQLLKLVEILSEMSMPPEVEALKAEGITTDDTDTPTPKAPQD